MPFRTILTLAVLALPLLSPALEPAFRAVNVDTQVSIGYGVTTADVDGDGRTDLLLCDQKQVAWYQNPAWKKHVIAENLTQLDHVCIAARDLDGDGRAEIAVGAGWNPGDTVNSGAVFYLDPPADRTRPWKPVALPHEPTVHRMRWVRDWQGEWTLIVVPLHGRGNRDGQGAGVKIQRYRRPAAPGEEWSLETLDQTLHRTHNFDPVPWDDDPAEELLVASREGVFAINWSREKGGYALEQLADDRGGGAGEVRLGRLSPTRRVVAAIEPMHGNTLAVYLPPEGRAGGLWERLVLDESLIDGHALACGDLLGLGRDQIVVGWRAMNRPGARVGIKLFIPADATGRQWRSVPIDDNTMACEDLCLADLNADGKLDIVASGRATRNLVVYFNESPPGP